MSFKELQFAHSTVFNVRSPTRMQTSQRNFTHTLLRLSVDFSPKQNPQRRHSTTSNCVYSFLLSPRRNVDVGKLNIQYFLLQNYTCTDESILTTIIIKLCYLYLSIKDNILLVLSQLL